MKPGWPAGLPENPTGNHAKVVQHVLVRIALDHGENNDHHLRHEYP
jgi:multidrug resistance efflux pump